MDRNDFLRLSRRLALGMTLISSSVQPAYAGCGLQATRIHAIQGSGPVSPLVASVQTVEAVVTASFTKSDQLRGFFLQEPDAHADADPATSEGLFVFAPGRKVEVGERVRVTGLVTEHRQRTELHRVSRLQRCGRASLPTPVKLDPAAVDLGALERWEGMLVEFTGPLVVTSTQRLGRFHQLALAPQRRFQPTQLRPPGSRTLQEELARQHLLLAGTSDRPYPAHIGFPPPGLTAERAVRSGDRVHGLRGVLDQVDDAYLLRPVARPEFESANPRPPPPPPPAAGQLRVAAFNLENYFNGDGRGSDFPTPRGAASPEELTRQRQKLLSALRGLQADIIGLIEVENDGYGPYSAVAELSRELGRATGHPYRFVHPGRSRLGDDAITVALLYRGDRVQPLGAAAILDAQVDPRFSPRNRPVLAQTFQPLTGGMPLTVAVNHLKSKGSECPGDPDRRDGQGHCNLTRTRAAQALGEWLAGDPTTSGSPYRLIIGDLNAYAQEDPLRALRAQGFVDLIARHLGPTAYTFVFDGRAGYLDHALASPALAPHVAAVRIWHINADEPPALDYRLTNKSRSQQRSLYRPDAYRSSDHDPVMVDLALPAASR